MEIIHGPRKQKVQCPLCTGERTFSRKDALRRHIRNLHPERYEDYTQERLLRKTVGRIVSTYNEEPRDFNSTVHTSNISQPLSASRPTSVHGERQSVSYDFPLTASTPAAQRQKLVSVRLIDNYNILVPYLFQLFTLSLRHQSQTLVDLLVSARKSVTAGRELLVVAGIVCAHDNQSPKSLDSERAAVDDAINQLEAVAQDIDKSEGAEGEGVVAIRQRRPLRMAASSYMSAATECFEKTKNIIDRIGDFECEA